MLKDFLKILLEAGEIVRSGYHSNKHIDFKGNIDLVTDFDKKTEAFLKEKIQALFPEYKIMAEESEKISISEDDKVIYIDPIDGTTNFVHGVPFVGISVGIFNGKIGQFGAVYNPIMDELYYAEYNKGAYLITDIFNKELNIDELDLYSNDYKIKVRDNDELIKSLVATGFPYVKDNIPLLLNILERVLNETRGIRRAGAASLDLCYVARGVYDLYYETKLKPWDMAAGLIIVKEAGGINTTIEGKELIISKDTSVVASNSKLNEVFHNLIKDLL